MIKPTRTIYDDPRFGEKHFAKDWNDLIKKAQTIRTDAYFEGSAGFERLIFNRTDREVCGVARPKWKNGEGGYWFRILPTGSMPDFP